MSRPAPRPSPRPPATELALLGAKTVSAALNRFITSPFRKDGAPTVYRDVVYAAMRALLSDYTISQARYLMGTTTGIYLDFCKKNEIEPQTLKIARDGYNLAHTRGETAHWIGNPDADILILYLHGGAYTQPCSSGHFHYLHRLVTDLNKSHGTTTSVSILLLAYDLVPEQISMRQLNQAGSLLRHLVETGRSPSRIILGGDSAGGGLALSLLLDMLHQGRSRRYPHGNFKLEEPLRGAFLISPWVSFDYNTRSMRENVEKDCVVPKFLELSSTMFLHTVPSKNGERNDLEFTNEYCEPLLAEKEQWEGVQGVVSEVLITGGRNEIMIDGIEEFAGKFVDGWRGGGGDSAKVTVQFSAGEAHDEPITDVMIGYTEKGESQRMIESWLGRLLL